MAGKFMNRNAIINTIKSAERTQAKQKREGTNNHVTATVCQCGDPDCGAFHTINESRPLPTAEGAAATLKSRKKSKP